MKQYEDAIKDYSTAISLNPSNHFFIKVILELYTIELYVMRNLDVINRKKMITKGHLKYNPTISMRCIIWVY